jgi:Rrf2 family protein
MIGPTMQLTAKVDYAIRAMVELAAAGDGPVKGEAIASAQGVPLRFLENILLELRHARLVRSQRGAEGGYRLARPAETITLADVIRTVEGPIASIRSERPDELSYAGTAVPLRDVWVALRANMRAVLEAVTVADVASGALPPEVTRLTEEPDVWEPH